MLNAQAEIAPKGSDPTYGGIAESDLVDCLPRLRAYAISLTKSRDRADDLLQETVVRALSAARQFQAGTNLSAWMFTILRHVHYNDQRRNAVRARSLDHAVGYDALVPPSQETRLEFRDFRRAFWQLADEQREALILVGAEGMSHEDASKVCGCPRGTIKSRVSRARRRLLQLLDEGSCATDRRGPSPVVGCAGGALGSSRA